MTVRVLHLIDSLDLGGAQEVLYNLVAHHDASRYRPEVAALHGKGPYWARLSSLDCPLHSLSPRKWIPLWAPRLTALLARNRFPIVHCHLMASNFIGKPIARILGVPVLINHDHSDGSDRMHRPMLLAADRWANRLSSHVLAVAETTREFLATRENIAEDRITVVVNGVDVGRFHRNPDRAASLRGELGIPPEGSVVLGVGRFYPVKNFSRFLRVAARVVERIPEAWFVLAGSGPEEDTLRRLADELKVTERVRFLGTVADMIPVYSMADVLLITSESEGTPMALLEALAAETAVVAPSFPGIAHVVTHGQEGFLVERDDEEGFARHVASLLEDRSLRQAVADRGLRTVANRFSAEAMTREVEAVYARLLNTGKHGPPPPKTR